MESHIIYLAFIEQLWFMVLIMSFLYLHTKPIQTLNTFGLDFLSLPIFFWTNHVASPILLSTSLTHIVWAMLTSISKECWFLTTWTVSHQRDFLATSFRIVNDAGRLIFPFLFFFLSAWQWVCSQAREQVWTWVRGRGWERDNLRLMEETTLQIF